MKTVRTYATSANLGPGFDCLGVCFDIYNEYDFIEQDNYELIGFDTPYLKAENNLIIQSYEKVFEVKNEKLKDSCSCTYYGCNGSMCYRVQQCS